MKINGREIGPSQPPFLVAELGANHEGSLGTALDLINAAKRVGADAVKFQAYEPGTITIDCDKPDFIMKDGPWKGRKLYELYEKAHTPFKWFPRLAECADKAGITWFSSVFDKTSIDMLEKLDCPAYKIASMEITDIPLIQYAASTGKPLIISTGMASWGEINDVEDTIEDAKDLEVGGLADHLVLLRCVSGYPAPVEESALAPFRCYEGISDHTIGWEVPVAATALGATIIEKHFMFPSCESEDRKFSLLPSEFHEMTEKVRAIWQAMQPSERKSEEPQRQARRSLYAVQNIGNGEEFTEENIRSIRPGYGLPPKLLPTVLGSIATRDIARGEPLKEGDVL